MYPLNPRRLLRTSGFNPNAGIPGLEEDAAQAVNPAAQTRPRRVALPPAGPGVDVPPIGGGQMGELAQVAAQTVGQPSATPASTPASGRPRFADPVDNARQEHMLAYDEKPAPRWKQALKTAALGFLQGAASNPQNPLAAGIGAGIAGAGLGAFKPDLAEAWKFEQYDRPGLEANIQRGQQQESLAAAKRRATLEEIAKATQLGLIQAQTEDIPVRRALDQQRLTNEANRQAAQEKLNREREQNTQQYRQGQIGLREREVKLKEQEAGGGAPGMPRKLTPADESAIKGQAEALATQAFDPDEQASILEGYRQQALGKTITAEDRKLAAADPLSAGYDLEKSKAAQKRIDEADARASRQAEDVFKREMQRWQQLIHDEVRARASNPPSAQPGPVTLQQVERVAKTKKLKTEDAKRLLRVLGYTVLDR